MTPIKNIYNAYCNISVIKNIRWRSININITVKTIIDDNCMRSSIFVKFELLRRIITCTSYFELWREGGRSKTTFPAFFLTVNITKVETFQLHYWFVAHFWHHRWSYLVFIAKYLNTDKFLRNPKEAFINSTKMVSDVIYIWTQGVNHGMST